MLAPVYWLTISTKFKRSKACGPTSMTCNHKNDRLEREGSNILLGSTA